MYDHMMASAERCGELKGELNNKNQVARNMLAMGMDIETIAKCTELSIAEIIDLQ